MLRKREISINSTILEALKRMDLLDSKLLIVMNGDNFCGLVSAGDIQRAIINNTTLDTPLIEIMRKNIRIARPCDEFSSIKQLMFDYRMELMPVVDDQNKIVNVYFWEDLFSEKKPEPKKQFDLPVIIMAGGFGTRLKPLTNVLPKPLIPLGETTIIEQIFQRFSHHGCNNFYISVNYKSELIQYYLKHQNLSYHLEFFKEEKPMGTAGSLSLLRGKIEGTFFVSNCDIIIKQDYSEILDYHYENKNEITVVAALKHYNIPYGTIETGENGSLLNLIEKPEITYKINSGMYILEPHLLNDVPTSGLFHITHLIESVMQKGGKVGVFPVSEKSWIDVGEWDMYNEASKMKI